METVKIALEINVDNPKKTLFYFCFPSDLMNRKLKYQMKQRTNRLITQGKVPVFPRVRLPLKVWKMHPTAGRVRVRIYNNLKKMVVMMTPKEC